MDKNLVNTHDKFFKTLFSCKEEVRDFITKTFPEKLVKNLNLKTLKLDKSEYVDEKLKSSFSDIVYNCIYGKNLKVKISLLFEHKSYIEKYPHLQILGYMLNIWKTQIKQKQDITPIIPIIFYHGKQKWNKKKFDEYFKSLDEELVKFIPRFDYHLIDTSAYTNQQIKELFVNLKLQIGLLVMKNIFEEQIFLQRTFEIFSGLNLLLQTEQGEHYFQEIVGYLYYATDVETQKFVEKMRAISPNAEKQFVSTAMRLEMKGEKRGEKRGKEIGIKIGIEKVALNLLKNGASIDLVAMSTGLTKKELYKLQETFE